MNLSTIGQKWGGYCQKPAIAWKAQGSYPGGGEIFRTCPDWPWGPPSLLYNGYRVSLPGLSNLGVAFTTHPTGVDVKERVELYLYSPYGLSWPVLGWTSIYSTGRSSNTVSISKNIDYKVNLLSRIISSTNFNAQFSLFINNMFVTLLSSTCFEH